MRAVLSSGVITCASSCPDLRSLVLLCCFVCPQLSHILGGASLAWFVLHTGWVLGFLFTFSSGISFNVVLQETMARFSFFPLYHCRRNCHWWVFVVCHASFCELLYLKWEAASLNVVVFSSSRIGHGLLMGSTCTLWRTPWLTLWGLNRIP